jgi:hypothetical protein
MPVKRLTQQQVGLKHGFKSGLEEKVAEQLEKVGLRVAYEEKIIPYTIPETPHKYHADFELPSGIIIETKGRFLPADRKKHELIKKQHPHLDIRFVFTNSKAKISKTSKTSYADWCLKHGFQFADKLIPQEWLKEPKSPPKRKPTV